MYFSQFLMIIWLILPLSLGLIFVLRKTRFAFWKSFAISKVIGYVLIVASAKISDRELNTRLYELDTNGDGVFSGNEMTPEVEKRLRAVARDTGRTFAPFTGLPFSVVWTSINLGVIFLIRAIVLRLKHKISRSERST